MPSPCRNGTTAEQQRRVYPDVSPLIVGLQVDAAFARALETAQQMGWTIVDGRPDRRRPTKVRSGLSAGGSRIRTLGPTCVDRGRFAGRAARSALPFAEIDAFMAKP